MMLMLMMLNVAVRPFTAPNGCSIPVVPSMTIEDQSANSNTQIDVFLDLLCPDSRATYHALKNISTRSRDAAVKVSLHILSLPYHQNSWIVAGGAFLVYENLGSDGFFRYLDAVYKPDDTENLLLYNTVDADVSEVIRLLGERVLPSVGLSPQIWLKQMGLAGRESNTNHWEMAHQAHMYAMSQQVTGTPWVTVNNVPVDIDASWSLAEWGHFLDSVSHRFHPPAVATHTSVHVPHTRTQATISQLLDNNPTPVPPAPEGLPLIFPELHRQHRSRALTVGVFLSPMCEDSSLVFRSLLQLKSRLLEREQQPLSLLPDECNNSMRTSTAPLPLPLQVNIHLMPQPNVRNSFLATKMMNLLRPSFGRYGGGADNALQYLRKLFEEPKQPTDNLTTASKRAAATSLVEQACNDPMIRSDKASGELCNAAVGASHEERLAGVSLLLAGWSAGSAEQVTRVSWKYGASLGVTTSPAVVINGIRVDVPLASTIADAAFDNEEQQEVAFDGADLWLAALKPFLHPLQVELCKERYWEALDHQIKATHTEVQQDGVQQAPRKETHGALIGSSPALYAFAAIGILSTILTTAGITLVLLKGLRRVNSGGPTLQELMVHFHSKEAMHSDTGDNCGIMPSYGATL